MSDAVLQTIEMIKVQIVNLEAQLAEKRRMVNGLCGLIGQPALYTIADESNTATTTIRNDEFYGQPLSTVVRSILEKRKAASLGAASVADIFEAMLRGGFNFGTSSAENSKRSLRISLTKNSAAFHRLPNGKYGLLEWYPNAKPVKGNGAKSRTGGEADTEDQIEQEVKDFRDEFEVNEESPADELAKVKPH